MDKRDWLALAEYLQAKVKDEQGKLEVFAWRDAHAQVVTSGIRLANLMLWERAAMEQAGEDPDANPERLTGVAFRLPGRGNPPTAREFTRRVIASAGQYGTDLAYICSVQPYGFTPREIGDALEQLEADGEVSYGETAGEKTYYSKG